ncbi:hypothetical protein Nepgr_031717 [Nepenthes gracilis]|uniref:Uncharacterized protein n=1 Tax=Nepenthes gracilis TaxID=150966 RepID=A0AAD3TIN4_NEPGR|nr:hypothetical protein Nepgr_031717 [Nepenthes gracilis]
MSEPKSRWHLGELLVGLSLEYGSNLLKTATKPSASDLVTPRCLRRAATNSKVKAVRDYEVLRGELPNNNKIAKSLYHAQVELRKSHGEAAANMR